MQSSHHALGPAYSASDIFWFPQCLGIPTPQGHHMALALPKTHVSHNALVKLDPTLYRKSSPCLMWTQHGIVGSPIHQGLTFTFPTMHGETQSPTKYHIPTFPQCTRNPGCSNVSSLSCVPQDTESALREGRNMAPIMHQDWPVLRCTHGMTSLPQ